MSFKIKDKIINIAVRSLIVIILVITLCVLVLWDKGENYSKVFESVLLIATGYLFGRGESGDDNNKKE
jgi:hypothetical protein